MVMPQDGGAQQSPGSTIPQQHQQAPILAATAPAVAGLTTVTDFRQRRLIGVSAWALALGSAGFVLGVVAMIRMMTAVPMWFEPTFGGVGVIGLVLSIAAFVTVRFRRVPWLLLGGSTVAFVIGVVLLGSI